MKKKDKNKNKIEHQKVKQKMFNDIFDEPFGEKREKIEKSRGKNTDTIRKGLFIDAI